MNMGLDLALLATETGTSPETHVPGQTRPDEPGGEKSLGGTDPWMRRTAEKSKDHEICGNNTERERRIGKRGREQQEQGKY